jgi:hypothetical protein
VFFNTNLNEILLLNFLVKGSSQKARAPYK